MDTSYHTSLAYPVVRLPLVASFPVNPPRTAGHIPISLSGSPAWTTVLVIPAQNLQGYSLQARYADTDSAPGLVFYFADNTAAAQTAYPPTTFRWIDNQKEAEEAVEAAKRKAARRAAQEESGDE